MTLRAPFPWFGGKRRAAALIWRALGDPPNYVEPFFGSGAALLARPPARPGAARTETVNDLDCVAPETRMLYADLRWRTAGEVKAGDRLLAFDESNSGAREGLRAPERYRRLRETTVKSVRVVWKPAYRLTFSDGTTVVASGDHLWLGGSHRSGGRGWRWVKTANMVCNRATQRSWVLKVCDVVDREETHEAGWIGGVLDGEGSIRVGPGVRACVSQNDGAVQDRVAALLRARGFSTSTLGKRRCKQVVVNGGLVPTLDLLMRFRPERLIENLRERCSEISLYGRDHRAVGLVSKEFVGEQAVVAIETDAHTFIAEGLASHNCYLTNFWRALQHAPEEVANWSDWPVSELDLHARHRWLVSRVEVRERMRADPDWFDAKVAGWWVWGLSQWIGSGWCAQPAWEEARATRAEKGCGVETSTAAKRPSLPRGGRGVQQVSARLEDLRSNTDYARRPSLCPPMGVQGSRARGPSEQLPYLNRGGQGVTSRLHEKMPKANRGTASRLQTEGLYQWMEELQVRLRWVRVCCGDFARVLGPSVTTGIGVTGVLLDPPYLVAAGRDPSIYAEEDSTASERARAWALEHGDDPKLRIVLCGYEGEHEMPASWRVVKWKAAGGYAAAAGNGENAERERLWLSPHCLHLEPKPEQLQLLEVAG